MSEDKQKPSEAGRLLLHVTALKTARRDSIPAAEGKSSPCDRNRRLQAQVLSGVCDLADICCGAHSFMYALKVGAGRRPSIGYKISLSATAVTNCLEQSSVPTAERMCRRSLRYRKPDRSGLR